MNINLSVGTNYNLKTDIMEKGLEEKLCDEIYLPMLEVYENVGISSNHFFAGWTAEKLNKKCPAIIKKINSLEKKRVVEIGSHTYGHPIIPLIPLEDTKKQIQFGKEIDENLFNSRLAGFYPPEWCIDPTLIPILKEEEYEWIMLLDSNIAGAYNQGIEETFFAHKIRGVNDSEIDAVFVYGGANNLKIRNSMFSLLENKIKPKECKDYILNSFDLDFKQKNSENEPLLLLYLDIEAPYFVKDTNKAIERFEYLLYELSSDDRINSVTISEYLEENRPESYIIPKSTATYKPIDIWKRGIEKLDIILEEVRRDLKQINDLEKEKSVWKEILLAEGSDARIAITKNRLDGITIDGRKIYGNFERVIDAYNHVLKAKQKLNE